MKEPYYTIKEASARVGVESHVLRYWEEELKMDIHRNQMGHRYYTEHDIDVLSKVKKLKDKGLQLKAIRGYIEKRQQEINDSNGSVKTTQNKDDHTDDKNSADIKEENNEVKKEIVPVKSHTGIMSNEEKLEQFQTIMNKILSNAIKENNELIGKSAGEHAANAVVNQFQGMTKEQEARAEERFRKLDQTLREIQLARKEAAASNMRPVDKRKQQRLKRKNKHQEAHREEQWNREEEHDQYLEQKIQEETVGSEISSVETEIDREVTVPAAKKTE